MKLNTFLAIAVVLAALYGLGFLLIPAQTIGLYGITLSLDGLFVARYLGSAFLGVAVLNWMARSLTSREALKPILLGDFVISLTGLVVAVWDALAGSGNALSWATVVIYLFLTLGFGYYQFLASPGS
ncbi:MAG TPA: hypothetical protein VLA49_12880 [Anaerolineales bacterium]|nr:hypothetical protein [Anaerolineales bacterium]